MVNLPNPTDQINLDFGHYLRQRRSKLAEHMVGGVPDYGFALDHQLRRGFAKVGVVRAVAKAVVAQVNATVNQALMMDSIAVGPRQYPGIYAIGEKCAQILGIGVPQIYIQSSGVRNAFTIAVDEVSPTIVITDALIEAMTMEELTFVIGHECGHVHNLHGVYYQIVELMTNPFVKSLLNKTMAGKMSVAQLKLALASIQQVIQVIMARWSQCGEITADRAGLICCGDPKTAQFALVRLVVGGSSALREVNLDEYINQINQARSLSLRFKELMLTHPLIPKRIQAIRLFAKCEIFHSWQPEYADGTEILTKNEVDQQCSEIIGIFR